MVKHFICRGKKKIKYWKYRLDGNSLTTYSGTDPQRMRETKSTYADQQETKTNVYELTKKKMEEGFVYLTNWEKVKPGELLFQMIVPGNSVSYPFDLHPTQDKLAVALMPKDAEGAIISIVDLHTGTMEPVHTCMVLGDQSFIHSLHFNGSGTGLYYNLNTETCFLDLESREPRRIGKYRQYRDSTFNPFCVNPRQDLHRERLLYYDDGNIAKVLDHTGNTCFEAKFDMETEECRRGTISPSGKLAAFYVKNNSSSAEIRIYNIDENRLIKSIPIDYELEGIGFTPDEEQLVFTHKNYQGPGFMDIQSGETVFYFSDKFRNDRWATCFNWRYSHRGDILAVGDFGLKLYNAASKERIKLPPEWGMPQRVHGITFAREDRYFAYGGDGGELSVRKMI